jgi:asparagine synthetase B (glutamine-hydrolysing)
MESLLVSSQAGRDRLFNSRRLLFNEPEKHALYAEEWRASMRDQSSSLAWLCSTLPDPGIDRLTRWQIHDVRTSLADEMLAKVDGSTMAWGVEARVPLLDHRLVELAVNLPAQLKIRRAHGKWILREVGARYLPREVLDRRKHGFTVPLSDWFRGPWKPLLDHWLGDAALRRVGVLEPRAVAQVRAHHDAAPGFTTAHRVFTLLCFQMWHDLVHRSS